MLYHGRYRAHDTQGKAKKGGRAKGKGSPSKRRKGKKRRSSGRSWVTLAGAYLVGVRAAGTLGLRLTAYATELRGWERSSDLVVMSRGGRAARRREESGEGAFWRSPSARRPAAGPFYCVSTVPHVYDTRVVQWSGKGNHPKSGTP